MVYNKRMITMLALSLMAMPAMVLADLDADVKARLDAIKEAKKTQDIYKPKIDKLKTQITAAGTDAAKVLFLKDRMMVVELQKKLAELNTDPRANAAAIATVRSQVDELNKVIAKYEADNATWCDTLIGAATTGAVAFGAWVGYEIVRPYIAGVYKSCGDRILPTVWSLGWKGAVALSLAVMAKNGLGLGKRSLSKLGRATKKTKLGGWVCGLFNKSE